MTPRQRTAFENPCHRAWETTSPELAALVRRKGATWGTILSINA